MSAARDSGVATWTFEVGRWEVDPAVHHDIALYVVAGALARRVEVGDQISVEMLGPGQVLRPAVKTSDETIEARTSWQVLAPSWLAVLDHSFWREMALYPEVLLAILDRMVLRSRSLAMRLAIVGTRNLPRRVLTLLWHLADAYGRVGQSGVVLDLSLSHDMLAQLVSARRSSVSKAVKDLERAGLLSRGPGKRFILHGQLPRATEPLPEAQRQPSVVIA